MTILPSTVTLPRRSSAPTTAATIIQRAAAALADPSIDSPAAVVESIWDAATPGQRAAVGRKVVAVMGRSWAADQVDPFNRFLAYLEIHVIEQDRPRKSRPQPFPILAPGEEPDGRWFCNYYEGNPSRFVVAAGEGTIELPNPAEGWSELCARLIHDACGNNLLGTVEDFDAATWGGPVPFLDRTDLLTAASGIDPDDVATDELLSALREAMRFVGLD